MKKILIAGYYGYANSGDDAILFSICDDIRAIGNSEITVLSKKPDMTKNEYGVRAIDRFKLFAVMKEIRQSDIVLMGGGSLLQDKTSTRSLLYYLSIIWYAKWRKKRCMLYANGIGPLCRPFNKRLTRYVVNKVDVISLRESLSNELLKQIGIKKPKIAVTADPVFNLKLEPVDVDRIFTEEKITTDKPLVGILFRSWEGESEFIEKIARVCDAIVEKYGMDILFIPMNYPCDLNISQEISKKMKNNSFILKNKYSATTMIEIVGKMKLVLSMRLHALLYASIKSVPMIGFAYDPKVDYYLKELDMYNAGDMESFDVNMVENYLEQMLSGYDEIQQQLTKKVQQLKKKAERNRNLLEALMKDEK